MKPKVCLCTFYLTYHKDVPENMSFRRAYSVGCQGTSSHSLLASSLCILHALGVALLRPFLLLGCIFCYSKTEVCKTTSDESLLEELSQLSHIFDKKLPFARAAACSLQNQ